MTVKQLSTPMRVANLQVVEDEKQWKFSGYATVFDNKNCYGFRIAKGAYSGLIAEGVAPKMYFNHRCFSVPIGKWVSMTEDDVGLRVEGVLTQGVAEANDVYHALKAGTLDGLSVSIRWELQDEEQLDNGELRVKRICELREISVVTTPADAKARVTQCLSADEIDERIERIQTLRDYESFLREAFNLSKRQSGWLLSKAKACIAVDTDWDDQPEAKELAAVFNRIDSGISNLKGN